MGGREDGWTSNIFQRSSPRVLVSGIEHLIRMVVEIGYDMGGRGSVCVCLCINKNLGKVEGVFSCLIDVVEMFLGDVPFMSE